METNEEDACGQIVGIAAPIANELILFKAKEGDKSKHELRIIKVEFKESLMNCLILEKVGSFTNAAYLHY